MRTVRRLRFSGGLLAAAAIWLVLGPLGTPARAADGELSYSPDIEAGEPTEPSPAFARIRHGDGELRVVREAGYDEAVSVNDAVFGGDELVTERGQRAELQLPDGALVRLDGRTRLTIYDIGEPGAGGRSVLGIGHGTLQADVAEARGGEAFRIDTPSASVYPLEPSSVRVDVERGDEVLVTVSRGRVEVAGTDGSVLLTTGERTRVRPGRSPLQPWDYLLASRDAFDRWVAGRDEAYALRQRPGDEYDDLPEPVRPYYGELREHGEWVWTEPYGWVWNPEVDDDWRPYARGRWEPGPHGPVWIGVEPWSWPVYRYGRWDRRVGIGWVWIPGRVFSTAHVVWYYGPDYVGWCPIGYYDTPVHVSIGFGWGHHWFDHHPWVFVGYDRFYYHRHVVRGHAGRVRPNWSRGVVTRRAVHVRPDELRGVGPVRHSRKAVATRASSVLRERAAGIAERGRAVATRVRDLDAAPDRGRREVRRVPFSEKERRLVDRRRAVSRSHEGVRAGDAPDRGKERDVRIRRSGATRGSNPGASPRGGSRGRGGDAGSTRRASPRRDSQRNAPSASGADRGKPRVMIRPGDRGERPRSPADAGSPRTRSSGAARSPRSQGEERVRRFLRQLDDDAGRKSRARTGSAERTYPRRAPASRTGPGRSGSSRDERYAPSRRAPSRGGERYAPRRSSPRGKEARPSSPRTPRKPSAEPRRSSPPSRATPSRGSAGRSRGSSAAPRRSSGPSRSPGSAGRSSGKRSGSGSSGKARGARKRD
jgi:hypothetical protein